MAANNPTRVEVNEVLDELEGHVRSTGSTIARDVSMTAEDGTPLIGRVVQHGSHQYSIVGEVGSPEVRLEYEFNLVEALAAEQAEADSQELDGDIIEQVGQDLRESTTSDHRKRVANGLRDRIAQPPLAPTGLVAGDFAYGFNLKDYLYPYHDMPSVTEFSDRSQTLVTTAWNGQQYLLEEYNVHDLLDGDADGDAEDTDEELPPERGVQ